MKALATIFAFAGVAAGIAACGTGGRPVRNDSVAQSGAVLRPAVWDPVAWRPPSLDELGNDSLANAIRRGHALVVATAESLPKFVGGNLNCTSCHLEDGRRGTAAPLTGTYARYPKY